MSEAPAPAAKPRRWLTLLPLIAFLALAGLFLVRLYSGDPQRLPSPLIGAPESKPRGISVGSPESHPLGITASRMGWTPAFTRRYPSAAPKPVSKLLGPSRKNSRSRMRGTWRARWWPWASLGG
jgi:hypothetical protein